MKELADCKTFSSLFGNKMLWTNKSIAPVTWWKAFCSDTQLSNVAVTILNFPPTSGSASDERSFSRQSYIHSKTRNRLTNEKIEKLVFVSHNLDVEKGNLKVKRIKPGKSPALVQTQNENQNMLAQSSNTADSCLESDTDHIHVANTSQLAGVASNQTTVGIENAPLETVEPVDLPDLMTNSYIGTGKSKKSFCGFDGFENSSRPGMSQLDIIYDSEDSNSSSQDLDLSSKSSD